MNKSSIPMETIENNAGNGKNKQSLIVNNITIRAINRSAVDIDKLRDALRAADRGRLQQLYNIYTDLLVDPILADAIDKLTTAITNAELTFTRNNKPEPRIDTLMDTPGFERVLVEIVLAHILGISVTEMSLQETRYSRTLCPGRTCGRNSERWPLTNRTRGAFRTGMTTLCWKYADRTSSG